MADDLGDAIKTSAQGPKSASGDSGRMQQHAPPEVIKADTCPQAASINLGGGPPGLRSPARRVLA